MFMSRKKPMRRRKMKALIFSCSESFCTVEFTIISTDERTKKAGIVGKYGTQYGASLRKQIKKMEVSQHSKYFCELCRNSPVCSKEESCEHLELQNCGKVKACGAYTLNTAATSLYKLIHPTLQIRLSVSAS